MAKKTSIDLPPFQDALKSTSATNLDNLRFDFPGLSENSLGNYLRTVFSTSSKDNIPQEILLHFDNPNQLRTPITLPSPNPPSTSSTSNVAANNGSSSPERPLKEGNSTSRSNRVPFHLNEPVESEEVYPPVHVNSNNRSNGTEDKQSHASVPVLDDRKSGQMYCDITDYLNMPQSDAARKLNVPTSTLSKRWKEAAKPRKWPWRTVCKIDKEITTLLHNIPAGGEIPEDVEQNLAILLRKRQEELRPVVIRL